MAASKLDFNQVLPAAFDDASQAIRVSGSIVPGSTPIPVSVQNALVTGQYNEVDLTYVASGNGVGEIQTATYKLSGATVATLTLSYDGSNRLISVVKS